MWLWRAKCHLIRRSLHLRWHSGEWIAPQSQVCRRLASATPQKDLEFGPGHSTWHLPAIPASKQFGCIIRNTLKISRLLQIRKLWNYSGVSKNKNGTNTTGPKVSFPGISTLHPILKKINCDKIYITILTILSA